MQLTRFSDVALSSIFSVNAKGSAQKAGKSRIIHLWSNDGRSRDTYLVSASIKQAQPQNRVRKKESVRGATIEQLLRIEEGGGFVGRVASTSDARESTLPPLSASDQRKVTQYVAQITRLKRRLDWRLERLVDRPLAQMEPRLLQLLRLGVYEVFEDELAPHAQNEHVNLAKSTVGAWSGGFVNAVLRSARRKREAGDFMLPPRPGKGASAEQWVQAMAVVYSHPTWMVQRWVAQLGVQSTEAILKANNRIPVYGVRANSLKGASASRIATQLEELGITCEESQWLPEEFVRLSSVQPILKAGLLEQGQCMVQDEAAGLVVAMLDPQPGEAILDACAAPGGKTLFISARMKNKGRVVAMDIHENRLRPLARAADRCGVGAMLEIVPGTMDTLIDTKARARGSSQLSEPAETSTTTVKPIVNFYDEASSWDGLPTKKPAVRSMESSNEDTWGEVSTTSSSPSHDSVSASSAVGPEHPRSSDSTLFDRVLLDVPCSGHGVLSKRADLRWRRQLEDLAQLTALQADLLDSGSQLVKPGGLLVYSTCSTEADENEEQIVAFLDRHPNFQPDTPPASIPSDVLQDGCLRTLPHIHGIDGAFAARLRRTA